MKYLVVPAFLVSILLSSPALGACWRLPNGQIIETNSNSTAPVRGARLVTCPPPVFTPRNEPPARQERYGVTEFDQRPDLRECTDFARSLVRSLPGGLFTMRDKTNIINSRRPTVGSVAIIEVPRGYAQPYGHVAVVEEVTRNSITIIEANYGGRRVQRRRSVGRDLDEAASQLRIVGYYRP